MCPRRLQNIPVKITALINDTTGTLIASHYVNPRTKIGVIFGTGCNAAYMEKVGNIEKIKHLGIPADQEMAINCEWVSGRSLQPSLSWVELSLDIAGCIRLV
jgi:hexokinase